MSTYTAVCDADVPNIQPVRGGGWGGGLSIILGWGIDELFPPTLTCSSQDIPPSHHHHEMCLVLQKGCIISIWTEPPSPHRQIRAYQIERRAIIILVMNWEIMEPVAIRVSYLAMTTVAWRKNWSGGVNTYLPDSSRTNFIWSCR